MTSSPAYAEHPEHTITVEERPGRVTVRMGKTLLAETERGLWLREASYEPAVYVPFEDCRSVHFTPTDHSTHCPFKGDARYWTLTADTGETAPNAAWAYDHPFDEVAAIAGHVAFYPDKVRIEVGEAG